MLLTDRLLVQGQWTFDRRGKLYLLAVLLLIPGIATHTVFLGSTPAELAWSLGCLALSLFGQSLRIRTVGAIPRGTSGRKLGGPRARELNTTGMYSVVRNPLYVGNSLVVLGLLATTRSPTLVIIYCLALVIYYERILLAEEHFLRDTFKEPYEQWAATTPAFFPRWRNWVKPNEPFSWAMVIRRELPGTTAIFIMYFLVQSAYRSVETESLVIDKGWGLGAAAAVAFYIVCKVVKKASKSDS